jgi:hypothetical protein
MTKSAKETGSWLSPSAGRRCKLKMKETFETSRLVFEFEELKTGTGRLTNKMTRRRYHDLKVLNMIPIQCFGSSLQQLPQVQSDKIWSSHTVRLTVRLTG